MKQENQRSESVLPLRLFVKEEELDLKLSGLTKLGRGRLPTGSTQANQINYKWPSSPESSRTSAESLKQRNLAR
jgi:hypothetical protein